MRKGVIACSMPILVLVIVAGCGPPQPSVRPGAASNNRAGTISQQVTAPYASGETQTNPALSQAAQPPSSTPADFLIFGNSGEPDSLDALDTFSGQALAITEQIEEPLVGRRAGSVGIMPLLALSWTTNADHTVWTFALRRDVLFHDGTPFDADAVVFNFHRMAEPDFTFGYRAQGKTYPGFVDVFGGPAGTTDTAWKGIEKIDEGTVAIKLKRPFPFLPEVLSAPYFAMSSPAAVKQAGALYGSPQYGAVGTGAFTFESWTPGENIVLLRNERYWGEPARMPGVIVRFIPDAAARLLELRAGAIDFATNLPADARDLLQQDPGLALVPVEPFNVAYLAMNVRDKPFDQPKVRRAIAHAINKQELLTAFYGGVGSVADTFLPQSLAWARPDNLERYSYDPPKARALLAEAGYPDGFKTMVLTDGRQVPLEFWYMPISRPYFSAPKAIAETFAAQLADVGIGVELKTEEWGAYLDNVEAGKKHGLWMLGWTGDYADPNNFLYVFFGPKARFQQGYHNQQLVDLLVQAGAATTQEERTRLFKTAGSLIHQDLPRIPIVHAPPVYGAKRALQGWQPAPFGTEPWKTVFIAK